MSKVRTISIPRIHDKKMSSEVNVDILIENTKASLEAMSDIDDKSMTIIIRNKDQNGEWFFSIASFALEDGQGKPEGSLVQDLSIEY